MTVLLAALFAWAVFVTAFVLLYALSDARFSQQKESSEMTLKTLKADLRQERRVLKVKSIVRSSKASRHG